MSSLVPKIEVLISSPVISTEDRMFTLSDIKYSFSKDSLILNHRVCTCNYKLLEICTVYFIICNNKLNGGTVYVPNSGANGLQSYYGLLVRVCSDISKISDPFGQLQTKMVPATQPLSLQPETDMTSQRLCAPLKLCLRSEQAAEPELSQHCKNSAFSD